MKNTHHETDTQLSNYQTLIKDCLRSCHSVLGRIERAKASLAQEFQDRLEANDKLLRLALNEAEALAWQTGFPHLVFPELAQEKLRSVTEWSSRQRVLRHAWPTAAVVV